MKKWNATFFYLLLLISALAKFALIFEYKDELPTLTQNWRTFLCGVKWSESSNEFVKFGFWIKPLWGYEGLFFGFAVPLIEVAVGSYFYWNRSKNS